jgi:cytochrome c oxidase subunit 4
MTGVRRYAVTFAALLVLLVCTIGAAFLKLGPAAFPIAMAIAFAKILLIGWFFMHLAEGPPLVRLVAVATLLWLLILIGFTMSDFATRPSSDNEERRGEAVRGEEGRTSGPRLEDAPFDPTGRSRSQGPAPPDREAMPGSR